MLRISPSDDEEKNYFLEEIQRKCNIIRTPNTQMHVVMTREQCVTPM